MTLARTQSDPRKPFGNNESLLSEISIFSQNFKDRRPQIEQRLERLYHATGANGQSPSIVRNSMSLIKDSNAPCTFDSAATVIDGMIGISSAVIQDHKDTKGTVSVLKFIEITKPFKDPNELCDLVFGTEQVMYQFSRNSLPKEEACKVLDKISTTIEMLLTTQDGQRFTEAAEVSKVFANVARTLKNPSSMIDILEVYQRDLDQNRAMLRE